MPRSLECTILLAGATCLIGREFAARWAGPAELHLLLRRAVPAASKLHNVHVVDFGALPQAAAACCCLGTTIKAAGSQAVLLLVAQLIDVPPQEGASGINQANDEIYRIEIAKAGTPAIWKLVPHTKLLEL